MPAQERPTAILTVEHGAASNRDKPPPRRLAGHTGPVVIIRPMSGQRPPTICLDFADQALAQRVADLLAQHGCRVLFFAACPPDAVVDVFLSDRAADAHRPPPATFPAAQHLVLGEAPEGIFQLPRDGPEGLLWQTCRLLATLAQRDRQLAALERTAGDDPLTGLPNRRTWEAEFPRRLAAGSPPVSLALLDLHDLKRLNDQRGHLAGDEALRRTASAIGQALQRDDFAARLGGDEFALLFTGRSQTEVADRLAGIRQRLAGGDSPPRAEPLAVAIGCGYSRRVWSEESFAQQLFAAADEALCRAKSAGQTVVWREVP